MHEFQGQGALEILLQTCNFSFMNRFTDGLHLPSEDEAIKVHGRLQEAVCRARDAINRGAVGQVGRVSGE